MSNLGQMKFMREKRLDSIMKEKSKGEITFSVSEIATMLRVSNWMVRKMMREGKIEGTREGKSWVVTTESLQKYMKERHG